MNAAAHPDELLPWYANRSLGEAERAEVEAHLRGCERCRQELEFLAALREQVQRAPATHADEVGLRRLLRQVRREQAAPRRRLALAAAAVVIVVQSAAIGWLATRGPGFEPLGGPAPAGVVLQLRFEPGATEASIRALLQAQHAVVIDGPSALGIYRVRLQGLSKDDTAAVRKSLAEFRAARGVVAQAELQ